MRDRRAGVRVAAAALLAVAAVSSTPLYGSVPIIAAPLFTPSGPYDHAGPDRTVTPGFVPTQPVNNAGTAIGYSSASALVNPKTGRVLVWGRAERWDLVSNSSLEMQGLGSAPDGRDVQHPYAINANGISVGVAERYESNGTYLGLRAVRWDAAGHVEQLGTLGTSMNGSSQAAAFGMNAAGAAVGYSAAYDSNGNSLGTGTRAVRWDAGSSVAITLPGVDGIHPGDVYQANAINDAGTAVGTGYYFEGSSLRHRALLWQPGAAAPTVLGTISDGYTNANAAFINASGVVAGTSDKRDSNDLLIGNRAVRWNAQGAATELGTASNGVANAEAHGLNDAGMVVGASVLYSNGAAIGLRPTRWDAGTSAAVQLDSMGAPGSNGYAGSADAINRSGSIVGTLQFPGESHAILWASGSTAATDLNALLDPASGWTLRTASGLSDTGFVTGIGLYDPDGAGGQAAAERFFTMLVPQAGTYGLGDANFDAKVNFDDLLVLAKRYNLPSSGATNVADFDLDGVTDFDDLLTLAKHYSTSPSTLAAATGDTAFAADYALALSLVPEPTTIAGIAAMGGLISTRRRR